MKDGPSNPSPTHSKTKTLTQKFCHLIQGEKLTGCGEPILETPNYELRAFEEVVQSMFEDSPSCTNQNSKVNARTKVSKIKRDLFAWLILFQAEINQVEEVITQTNLRSNLFQTRGG